MPSVFKGQIEVVLHGSWNETLPREEVWEILSAKGENVLNRYKGNSLVLIFHYRTTQARDSAYRKIQSWGREQESEENSSFAHGVDLRKGGAPK